MVGRQSRPSGRGRWRHDPGRHAAGAHCGRRRAGQRCRPGWRFAAGRGDRWRQRPRRSAGRRLAGRPVHDRGRRQLPLRQRRRLHRPAGRRDAHDLGAVPGRRWPGRQRHRHADDRGERHRRCPAGPGRIGVHHRGPAAAGPAAGHRPGGRCAVLRGRARRRPAAWLAADRPGWPLHLCARSGLQRQRPVQLPGQRRPGQQQHRHGDDRDRGGE